MDEPRAVVVPFGVPDEARGLGLGLAALIHMHVRIRGGSVALARLEARKPEETEDAPLRPVEAFFNPAAWANVQEGAAPPPSVEVILTGALEPPAGARGCVQFLAFDAAGRTVLASHEAHLEDAHAGDQLAEGVQEFARRIDAEPGVLSELSGLSWDALESVLLAERNALVDVARRVPHDRLAALMHLGRAVSEAPHAPYPSRRLAALAVDSVLASDSSPRLIESARRVLEGAAVDAPEQPDLAEALCVVCMRTGDGAGAEARAAILGVRWPGRVRVWLVLSEARRMRGEHAGALAAVDEGLAHVPGDLALSVERGVVLAERGDLDEAAVAWREVMLRQPLHAGAFANLAQLAAATGDARIAGELVDNALSALESPGVHPEVFRRAMDLVMGAEADGLPRATRVATLARAILARLGDDPHAMSMLAHATSAMGDTQGATALFEGVLAVARGSTLAAEAQRGLFALQEPAIAAELDAALRASMTAEPRELEAVAARARHLAMAHGQWLAHFALGIAERRRGRWTFAREAFAQALALAPGCGPILAELAEVEQRAKVARSEPPPGVPGMGPLARLRNSWARLRR